jgi:predicted O-linked N-acetylglucosamine transferase (SPINDLY family)
MSGMTIQQAMDLAVARQRDGDLQQAETIYREILQSQPDHPEAYSNLGLVLRQLSRPAEAVAAYQRALEIRPVFFEALVNLGNACQDLGQNDAAISAFEKAIAIRPDSAEAFFNMGNALSRMGRVDAAIDAFKRAIQIRPGFAAAFNAMGAARGARVDSDPSELDDSIEAFREAVRIKSDFAEAWFNLGHALCIKGGEAQLREAIDAFRKTIALRPKWPHGYQSLGNALRAVGELSDAESALRRALELNPDSAEAHYELGAVLAASGQVEAAIESLRTATAIKPDFVKAFNHLGIALREIGRIDESEDYLRRGTLIPPGNSAIFNTLSVTLKHVGKLDEAVAAGNRSIELDPHNVVADDNRVYALWYHPDYNAEAILREHRVWNQRHAEPLRKFIKPHDNNRSAGRKLRIGYVSQDFRGHIAGRHVLPLFQKHDREQFEVYCYFNSRKADAMTAVFRECSHGWHNIKQVEDAAAAEMIRADKIDILVDLSLHMAGNRLLIFARKPAPVQMTFTGYPGTTGLDAIDWRLTDPHLDPPWETEQYYSEKSYRLPHSFWCFDPEAMEANNFQRAESESGQIVFGCLNNFCKINDGVLDLWSRVLRQVQNSRLVFLVPPGRSRQRVTERFSRNGVAAHRIEFVRYQKRAAYFDQLGRFDICLDTFPYNGHATSLDALWMGTPVVTLVGKTVAGRAGLSQMTNLGLSDLAAFDEEQFVMIATALANDLERLGQLHRTLRERMANSPLTNAKAWTRGIEAAYREIWNIWLTTSQKSV